MDIIVCQEQARVPVTIFHLKDRINLGNVEQLIQKAQEAFANGARDLLIDLTNVPPSPAPGLERFTPSTSCLMASRRLEKKLQAQEHRMQPANRPIWKSSTQSLMFAES